MKRRQSIRVAQAGSVLWSPDQPLTPPPTTNWSGRGNRTEPPYSQHLAEQEDAQLLKRISEKWTPVFRDTQKHKLKQIKRFSLNANCFSCAARATGHHAPISSARWRNPRCQQEVGHCHEQAGLHPCWHAHPRNRHDRSFPAPTA